MGQDQATEVRCDKAFASVSCGKRVRVASKTMVVVSEFPFMATCSMADGEELVVEVRSAYWWNLGVVRVVKGPHLGTFDTFGKMVGTMREYDPSIAEGENYLDSFKVYVTPPLENCYVGDASGTYSVNGEKIVYQYSPHLAEERITILPQENGTGAWYSLGCLRPLVPDDIPTERIREHLLERRRRGQHHKVGKRKRSTEAFTQAKTLEHRPTATSYQSVSPLVASSLVNFEQDRRVLETPPPPPPPSTTLSSNPTTCRIGHPIYREFGLIQTAKLKERAFVWWSDRLWRVVRVEIKDPLPRPKGGTMSPKWLELERVPCTDPPQLHTHPVHSEEVADFRSLCFFFWYRSDSDDPTFFPLRSAIMEAMEQLRPGYLQVDHFCRSVLFRFLGKVLVVTTSFSSLTDVAAPCLRHVNEEASFIESAFGSHAMVRDACSLQQLGYDFLVGREIFWYTGYSSRQSGIVFPYGDPPRLSDVVRVVSGHVKTGLRMVVLNSSHSRCLAEQLFAAGVLCVVFWDGPVTDEEGLRFGTRLATLLCDKSETRAWKESFRLAVQSLQEHRSFDSAAKDLRGDPQMLML